MSQSYHKLAESQAECQEMPGENYNERFEVRDFRNKHFLMVDDAYLNGYAKKLDVYATAVYLSLWSCCPFYIIFA